MSGQEGNPAEGALVPVEAEIAEIEGEMGNHASRYWLGPEAPQRQQRYRDLLTARLDGKPAPKTDARQAEILKIEAMIASEPGKYWRDAALQARYRVLLVDGPVAPDAAGDGSRASLAEVARTMPAAAEAFADDANVLGRAQDRAAEIAGHLGPEGWAEESGVFAGLPDLVQSALLVELGRLSPGHVQAANENDMALFRLSVPGADGFIRAWGRAAARKVGAILDAGQRLDAKLDGAGCGALASWWTRTPVRARMAMVWTIGNNA